MNKTVGRKNGNDGFTLMEALVSIAVILVISGCVFTAFSASVRMISKARRTTNTALKILQIDRFIREETESLHVPYWADTSARADLFEDYLSRSAYGRYIRQFDLIRSRAGTVRGIRVFYTVDGASSRTDALFPSIPVLEKTR
jgi:prepilin-type N-terminal cleavage/methylation domain-containing protein